MSVPEGLLEVGKVGRPHGVLGDVFVNLTTDRTERVEVGTRLWARGQWYEIEQSHRSGQRFRVHLTGVEDRTTAQALTGTALYAEPIDDPDALWVHQLIGARVVDVAGGERGICVAVVDNPASDLLELESGALVPATFVSAVDTSGDVAVVTIDPPDGLFELFDPEA